MTANATAEAIPSIDGARRLWEAARDRIHANLAEHRLLRGNFAGDAALIANLDERRGLRTEEQHTYRAFLEATVAAYAKGAPTIGMTGDSVAAP